jgi:hypothetical protein
MSDPTARCVSEVNLPGLRFPGPRPDSLHLELDVAFTDMDGYVQVADPWMRHVPQRLAAEDLALIEAVGCRTTSWSRHRGSFGEPGTPWARSC